jgi:hypothetical protein
MSEPETDEDFERRVEARTDRMSPMLAALVREQEVRERREEKERLLLEQQTAEANARISEEMRAMLARLSEAEKFDLSLVLNKEVEEIKTRQRREAAHKDAINYLWGKVRPVAKQLGVDRRKARETFLEVMQQIANEVVADGVPRRDWMAPPWANWEKKTSPQVWEAHFRERGLVP